MEPVLGGRDDRPPITATPARVKRPQWSPSLADGTTQCPHRQQRQWLRAAMEPVLGGRDDAMSAPPATAVASGRNGARPWRTGRPAAYLPGSPTPHRPQWSPSLADGTTSRVPRGGPAGCRAAMEPVLGGRDDLASTAPTAARSRGRNGARPWRTGRHGLPWGYVTVIFTRRNGARPWRTGRRAGRPAGDRARQPAAMEPVLGGRDDHRLHSRAVRGQRAAMEPVLGGRDDGSPLPPTSPVNACRNGARPWRTGRRTCRCRAPSRASAPQWSPSLADGTTRAAPARLAVSLSRNGARPWRTGRRFPGHV